MLLAVYVRLRLAQLMCYVTDHDKTDALGPNSDILLLGN